MPEMAEIDDIALLREYALRNSERAFSTLVLRHIDLVYSAALRQVGNHHNAQEISQAVFVILARKAGTLSPETILPGWLFRTARLTAANHLRTEIRRARREQEAFMQSNPPDDSDHLWQQMTPLLNDLIDDLREKDRDAIVLRFLKGKDYREVGAALGATEEAAQMRVSRALDKLRRLFAKRGVVISATALGAAIITHGTHAAPVGFAASVAAAAIQSAAVTASTLTLVEGTLKIMAWTKLKFAIAAGIVAVLAYEYHQNSVQAQQLNTARASLRGQTEAFAALEHRIAELNQQTAAISETREAQQRELDRLRARLKPAANPGASAPTTLLSAMLQDATMREMLRNQMVENYRSRYIPFAMQLNLDPDQGEKLIQTAGDGAMKILDAVAAFSKGELTAQAALNVEAEAMRNATNQVRLALGEDGFAKFEEYNRTWPAQSLLDQFDKQLGPFPISAYQRAGLSNIFQAEQFDATRQLAGEVPVELVVHPEELAQRFDLQSQINHRILQRSAELLSADQLETLALMQTNNLTAQRRDILRMLRKL
jgi:RNA polymerase sigma factor (sigma-70 family)